MLFCEKVRVLLKELGVARTALARAAGLDASLISRFYSGERVPSRFSSQLDKLSMGVAVLALQHDAYPRICALCGVPESTDVSVLADAVNSWINMPDSELRPRRAHKPQQSMQCSVQQKEDGAFAEKLDALMRAAEVTNTELARYLNVDASLISRFRAGVRRPDANERIVANICTFFSLREYTPKQREAVFHTLRRGNTEDKEALLAALRVYLQVSGIDEGRVYVDNLLETLDSMRIDPAVSAPIQPSGHELKLQEGDLDIYHGNAGLRCAMLRMLECMLEDGNVKEFRLFSDLDLQWALEDEAFLNVWPAQLKRLMEQGTRFTLVLSMGTNLNGVLLGMKHWIPLFLTGNFHVYLLSRPYMRRLSCTMILADKLAAIQSFCVAKTVPFAYYLYTRQVELIENARLQFDALCESGCVSVQMFGKGMQVQYQRQLSAFERAPGDTDVVLHSLPAYTISPSLMEQMLKRSGIPQEIRDHIVAYQQLAAKRAIKNLSLYRISDYICLADPTDLKAGRLQVELPWVDSSVRVYYTPAEYAEHIRETLELLNAYPGYSIYLLPEVPFQNVMFMVRQGVGTLIRKLDEPSLAMITAHPALLSSLSNYIDILKLRSIRVHPDHGRGLRMMMQYLQFAPDVKNALK